MTAEVRIGCSGWVYRHWKGVFYPEDLPQKRWFEYYSSEFDTVKINKSFYGLPPPATFEKWRKQAPPGFCYWPFHEDRMIRFTFQPSPSSSGRGTIIVRSGSTANAN
jgi:hypothetical protein